MKALFLRKYIAIYIFIFMYRETEFVQSNI